MASLHDQIAEKLARKFGTEYKKHKGIDIVLPKRVIEVETKAGGVAQGITQVQRSSKARYLAVNRANVDHALEATEGTGIGVMNERGKILKKASRSGG